MQISLNGFALDLELLAARDGRWIRLPLMEWSQGFAAVHKGIVTTITISRQSDRIDYQLTFKSEFRTRLRVRLSLRDQDQLFHLIPGNIHGDNNAAYVRPGEFPCLAKPQAGDRSRAELWEFRADRSSHPVSILCCKSGAVGISIDPYSDCADADDGFIRNGVFAALPNEFGVAVGYGNDPLTFADKTYFIAAQSDTCHGASASGTIFAFAGDGRREAHKITRTIYQRMREIPTHQKSHHDALRALADAFIEVNYSKALQQYTNRKCLVPVDTELTPWRAIVEIGWTGGAMLAYPFALAERIFPDLRFSKTPQTLFDEICSGYNPASGFINDAAVNRFTQKRPESWNQSDLNGWWSGFLPQTLNVHCAYTNAQAAFYLLKMQAGVARAPTNPVWKKTALAVLDNSIALQRDDGAFGYLFSSTEKKVTDWDGFAGCWFAAACPLAFKLTRDRNYLDAASRALRYYHPFVRDLAAWGSPMDTCRSIDSEGNLAFIRAARLMHEATGEQIYLDMLTDGANYEYLWRYAFRARPQAPPLKGSNWNSCGGSITSVSNPHMHPMSVVADGDLRYLARITGDKYHSDRADDALAWLLNTMELYPDVMGYGRYGVLSERTCPSDGLLSEQYHDDGSPASTWWSYNAWAAGSAMEALAEYLIGINPGLLGPDR